MKHIWVILFCLLTTMFLQAQENTALTDYAVQVTGTSTLHAWTVNVNQAKGSISSEADGTVSAVVMEFEVASMDGGRGPAMNDKIKKALSASTHPWITFHSNTVKSIDNHIEVNGLLNIGGNEQPITLIANPNEKNYTCTVDLTFSLFEIVPPSAMFGQIKCGDNISIVMDVTF